MCTIHQNHTDRAQQRIINEKDQGEAFQAIPYLPSQQRKTAAPSDKAGEKLVDLLRMAYYLSSQQLSSTHI